MRPGQRGEEKSSMRKILLTTAITVAIGVVMVTPAYADEEELLGTLGGAALGGFVGSQFGSGTGQLAATGAGVLVGGLLGNSVGRSMDRPGYGYGGGYAYPGPTYYGDPNDYERNYVAPPAALPPQVVYVRPEAVDYRPREPAVVEGSYMEPGYDAAPSRYCREFTQQIRIDNEIKESYGTACLQPDGTWRIER